MKTLVPLLLLVVSVHGVDLVEHAKSHPDGKAAFSFDASAWQNADDIRKLPVGVFDSGIGGLNN